MSPLRASCQAGRPWRGGTEFLAAEGTAAALHTGWRAALNILEYASGIATATARLVAAARRVNPDIAVVTTRKTFPGTRKTAIKAILAGGALPHRLGLSETILVFKQHLVFMGGRENFLNSLPELRAQAREKKIIVEAESLAEALPLAAAGVDVIQVDKLPPPDLAVLVREVRAVNPTVQISAAGGINEGNAAAYAATGVHILVLSSLYFSKPADMGVRMAPA